MTEDLVEWDKEILDDICNKRDKELIQQVHIPIRKRADSWYRLFSDTGKFTVRSCYRMIKGENECPDRMFWNKVWNLKLPGKVVSFVWRMCKDVIPTAVNLISKRVNILDICAWCQTATEDGMEGLISVMPGETVMQVAKRFLFAGSKKQGSMFGMICWALWYRRNKLIWEKMIVSVFGIKSMALNMFSDWRKATEVIEGSSQQQQQKRVSLWSKPPDQWVKINTDASCDLAGGVTGLGCVARDDRGQFLRARINKVQVGYLPKLAEALSMREALSWTKGWSSSKCVFETDAKILVEAINADKDNQGCSTFDCIVDDCKELIKHFEEVLIVFTPKSANSVAHLLAKGAHSMSGLQEWICTAPDLIICNLTLKAN
ncbi:uncharacterized protein LOC141719969 [Apium graveolens]|uniref:uncharacterized protein LOC141719969 n=1 Tax=Apium graveolens TaxID=4045 RepID=UPI003D7ADC3A